MKNDGVNHLGDIRKCPARGVYAPSQPLGKSPPHRAETQHLIGLVAGGLLLRQIVAMGPVAVKSARIDPQAHRHACVDQLTGNDDLIAASGGQDPRLYGTPGTQQQCRDEAHTGEFMYN